LDVADLVLFVGPKSSKCLKARTHPKGDALHTFASVAAACEYLVGALGPGDLVLLKGSGGADNLGRLCAVEGGGQSLSSREPMLARDGRSMLPANVRRPEREAALVRVVVGLGNPGEDSKDTPHNVGQRMLDQLARSLGAERWERRGKALVATADRAGTRLYLVKPLTYVNDTGPPLMELSHEIGFEPGECVLVQDDIDLPLGTIRVRMRGSDGGHKGVRSVLQAVVTNSIARVKIGVGRPGQAGGAAAHVVRPFSAEELTAIKAAYAKAADKVLEVTSRLATAAAPPITAGSGTVTDAAQVDTDRLSPFGHWQLWRNVKDADVGRLLRQCTELPATEITRLERLQGTEINQAKKVLAFEMTRLRYGHEAAEQAAAAARGLFESTDEGYVEGLPIVEIDPDRLRRGVLIVDFLRLTDLAASSSNARRLIRGGGIRLNGSERISDEARLIDAKDLREGHLKLSAGKKRHVLVRPA